MRPEPEAREGNIGNTIAETLKKNVATMRPDLCPKSGPSFWLGMATYVKNPYLGPILSLDARATFWPAVWPQSGQILIQLFAISNSFVPKTGSNSGRISAMSRGRHPVLRTRFGAAV